MRMHGILLLKGLDGFETYLELDPPLKMPYFYLEPSAH
jgi:hypothetical protein